MTVLVGSSFVCAQGENAAACAQLEHPLPPARVDFHFLGQALQAAYFRSHDVLRLELQALAALVHRHICQAAAAAGWPAAELADVAVLMGSSSYTMADTELRQDAAAVAVERGNLQLLAEALRTAYGYRQIHAFATACTSSAHALLQAQRLLDAGVVTRALVVGVESFNLLSLAHFHSLGLLTDEYRVFGGNGFVLGEGVACLALSAKADGAFRLLSAVARTDAAGLTEVTADSLTAVMQAALLRAGVGAADVALIKAHAVGSAGSDAAEAAALQQVFGRQLPWLCFKPHIGHTLGAGGALEMALMHQWLHERHLPATLLADGRPHVLARSGVLLANFFGFGGNQVAMVWRWQHD